MIIQLTMSKTNRLLSTLLSFILLSLITHPISGQTKNDCPPGTVKEILSLTNTDYSDLAFLKPLLKDKKVVLLGESSHGIGDYYALKARLIRYLHQECGFRVLSLESGIADIFLEYQLTDSLSPVRLRNNTVYGNFQCKEILPLFEYIKETRSSNSPLIYSGFDSQNFSASLRLLQKIMHDIKGPTGDSVLKNLNLYYRIPSLLWQEDRSPLFALADSIKSAAAYTLECINKNQEEIIKKYKISPLAFKFLQRSLSNHIESVSLNWRTEDPVSKRDSLMAANLFWLMDEIYPDQKFIIWGHNGHIDKKSPEGNPYKWMGHFVQQRFGKAAFHIGLFAKEGETFEWWTKTNKAFHHNQLDDLENSAAIYPISFIQFNNKSKNCSWARQLMFGFEVESGGRLSFVPSERFDAIINFRKVKLPVYE